jgi:hypothetical protein
VNPWNRGDALRSAVLKSITSKFAQKCAVIGPSRNAERPIIIQRGDM